MWDSWILVAALITPLAVADDRTGPEVLCIYPLSGVYGPIQRFLFYLLLAFGVLGRRQRWLIAGALASAMSYSGAAAIHSILLLTKVRSPNVDLDIYGVFAITSTGVMLTAQLLAWSTTFHAAEKEIRAIIVVWAALETIGAFFAVILIYIKGSISDPPCIASIEDTYSLVSSLRDAGANCTYVCLREEHPLLRSSGSLIAWHNKLDPAWDITSVFVPTIASTIPASIITWIWIRRQGWSRQVHSDYLSSPSALDRFELGWIGSWILERRRNSHHRRVPPATFSYTSAQNQVPRHQRIWLFFRSYAIIASCGGFLVNLTLNEVRFWSLPTHEAYYDVGQWSPWVSVALVLVAQVLSQGLKIIWQKNNQREDEEELRAWERRERGNDEGWESLRLRRTTSSFRHGQRRNSSNF